KRRPWLAAILILLVLAASGAAIWWFVWGRKAPPDMVAVLKANNRGVGFMEKFQYDKAVAAFEEVVKMAPDWLPGRINLGIALLNLGGEKGGLKPKDNEHLQRAVAWFQEILKDYPDDPHAHYCLGLIYVAYGDADDAERQFTAVTRIDPQDAHSWA